MNAARRAFTVIELMVVIAIMALMAGLLVALMGSNAMRAKIERTKTILAVVDKGIALTAAQSGGSIGPVEHPLAGSRAPRFAFRRSAPASDAVASVSAGPALDGAATALAGLSSTAQLPGGGLSAIAADLMLPSDLYADRASYLLFGLRRDHIGILGSVQKRFTKYILLPQPVPGQATLSPASFPALTTAALPTLTIPTDAQDVDSSYGHPSATKQALDYLFGASGAQAELSALNALYMADPTTAANTSDTAGGANTSGGNAFRYPINAQVITSAALPASGQTADNVALPMLYSDGTPEASWEPGCVYVTGGVANPTSTMAQAFSLASGASGGGPGRWVHYRLPGLAIYDAWKVEVLYTVTPQGGNRLMSAGPDGVFAFNPGPNHLLDSTDPEASPSGDDVTSRDNIVVGAVEQQ